MLPLLPSSTELLEACHRCPCRCSALSAAGGLDSLCSLGSVLLRCISAGGCSTRICMLLCGKLTGSGMAAEWERLRSRGAATAEEARPSCGSRSSARTALSSVAREDGANGIGEYGCSEL